MDYEAKFRAKTSDVSQAWGHTFLNLRHNSEHVDLVIGGTGRPQENSIFWFLKIHKKNPVLSKSNFFRSSLHEI